MVVKDKALGNLEIARDIDSWALREETIKVLDKRSGKMRQKYKVHGYFVSVENAVKKARQVIMLQRNEGSVISLDNYLDQMRVLKKELEHLCN